VRWDGRERQKEREAGREKEGDHCIKPAEQRHRDFRGFSLFLSGNKFYWKII